MPNFAVKEIKLDFYDSWGREIILFFLNILCDAHHYPAKFEIKIQLVYGVTKKRHCIME